MTSKKDGYTDKYIFLPAAGYRYGSMLGYAGQYGYYWLASLHLVGWPYYLYFNSGHWYWYDNHRSYGQAVRPVCP